MGIFDFIKSKKREDSPEKILHRIVDYMPRYYSDQRQFINCIDFLKHHEYGLAVDSLIELAEETDHYFSNELWTELIKVCAVMRLPKQAIYCGKQLLRNTAAPSCRTYFGSTVNKIDDTHFEHYISEKIKDEWATERRTKDKVEELIEKEGVHIKSHGRSGILYYVKNGKIAEVEYELGMKGAILWLNSVNGWSLPSRQDFVNNEKAEMRNAIIEWSNRTGNEIDLD